jgi:hypothetical protein
MNSQNTGTLNILLASVPQRSSAAVVAPNIIKKLSGCIAKMWFSCSDWDKLLTWPF